jgi:hypothetical protein
LKRGWMRFWVSVSFLILCFGSLASQLPLEDSASRVMDIYGKRDSRSPSTKGGQQLELLYYAFDWAGPDVPQVMEVLCTMEKDGKPGRVVEITLAAPSL